MGGGHERGIEVAAPGCKVGGATSGEQLSQAHGRGMLASGSQGAPTHVAMMIGVKASFEQDVDALGARKGCGEGEQASVGFVGFKRIGPGVDEKGKAGNVAVYGSQIKRPLVIVNGKVVEGRS